MTDKIQEGEVTIPQEDLNYLNTDFNQFKLDSFDLLTNKILPIQEVIPLLELKPGDNLKIYTKHIDGKSIYYVKMKHKGKIINQPVKIDRRYITVTENPQTFSINNFPLQVYGEDGELINNSDFYNLLDVILQEVTITDFPTIHQKDKIEIKENLFLGTRNLTKNIRINPALDLQVLDHLNQVRQDYYNFMQQTGRKIFSNMDLYDPKTDVTYNITDNLSYDNASVSIAQNKIVFNFGTEMNHFQGFDYYTIAHEMGHAGDLLTSIKTEDKYSDTFDKLYQKKFQKMGRKRDVVNPDWLRSTEWQQHDKFLVEVFADSRSVLLYMWNFSQQIMENKQKTLHFQDWENFYKRGKVTENMVYDLRKLNIKEIAIKRFLANDQGNELLTKILNFDPSPKKNAKTIKKTDYQNLRTALVENKDIPNISESQERINEKVQESLEITDKLLTQITRLQEQHPGLYTKEYHNSFATFHFEGFYKLLNNVKTWFETYLNDKGNYNGCFDISHILYYCDTMKSLNIEGTNENIKLIDTVNEYEVVFNNEDDGLKEDNSFIEILRSIYRSFLPIQEDFLFREVELGHTSIEEVKKKLAHNTQQYIQMNEDFKFYEKYQALKALGFNIEVPENSCWEVEMSLKYEALKYEKNKNILDEELAHGLIDEEAYEKQLFEINLLYEEIQNIVKQNGKDLVKQEEELSFLENNQKIIILNQKIDEGIICTSEDFYSNFIDVFGHSLFSHDAINENIAGNVVSSILQKGINKGRISEHTINIIKEYQHLYGIKSNEYKDLFEPQETEETKKLKDTIGILEQQYSQLSSLKSNEKINILNKIKQGLGINDEEIEGALNYGNYTLGDHSINVITYIPLPEDLMEEWKDISMLWDTEEFDNLKKQFNQKYESLGILFENYSWTSSGLMKESYKQITIPDDMIETVQNYEKFVRDNTKYDVEMRDIEKKISLNNESLKKIKNEYESSPTFIALKQQWIDHCTELHLQEQEILNIFHANDVKFLRNLPSLIENDLYLPKK